MIPIIVNILNKELKIERIVKFNKDTSIKMDV